MTAKKTQCSSLLLFIVNSNPPFALRLRVIRAKTIEFGRSIAVYINREAQVFLFEFYEYLITQDPVLNLNFWHY